MCKCNSGSLLGNHLQAFGKSFPHTHFNTHTHIHTHTHKTSPRDKGFFTHPGFIYKAHLRHEEVPKRNVYVRETERETQRERERES
jgi:hypothetical protein